MKKSVTLLFSEIRTFIKNDFHLSSYLFVFTFTGISIALNYKFGFYREIMRGSYFEGNSMLYFPLFYLTMYFTAALPLLLLRKQYKILNDYRFYLKSIFIISIYGLSIGYFDYQTWSFPTLFQEEIRYISKIISQFKSLIFYFIPLIIMKKTIDKKIDGLYGLSKNSSHLKGYLSLYLMLLPFLILMSFSADFQHAYPQFKPWQFGQIFDLSWWIYTPIFELSYAIDFIMTELLFRGALVIGMVSILGRNAVLPMVTMYAAIHFGKPLAETISSVFGGFILGALAYQTRHIWGGVIVHIGIALTMEVMGIFQHRDLL